MGIGYPIRVSHGRGRGAGKLLCGRRNELSRERARDSVRLRSLVASQTTYGWIMDDEEIQLLANLGLWLRTYSNFVPF